MRRLSVIVTNYNYERYVGDAIASALDLDWSDLEVIVVDDGSTDGSHDIISSFGDRILALRIANSKHRGAANAGYARSTGDVVIFLDADDLLPRGLPAALDRAMGPGVSKVQVPMQRIDADGRAFGAPFPRFDPLPTPRDIRRWMTRTSAYPTPPGSGNAYARWFLDRIFPVGPELGDAADSACLAAAPVLGDVVTLAGPAVSYRQHGANDSDLSSDPALYAREVGRAVDRWRFAARLGGLDVATTDMRPLRRSRELLQFRAAATRVTPGARELGRDRRSTVLLDAVRSVAQPGPDSASKRLLVAAWAILVASLPLGPARRLIRARFR